MSGFAATMGQLIWESCFVKRVAQRLVALGSACCKLFIGVVCLQIRLEPVNLFLLLLLSLLNLSPLTPHKAGD